ncbi:MAG: hypothetical protein J7L63_05355 [Thermoplasmata archaeon]|nr:hypothetical protein [Thermoplasmata archaeon]
MERYARRSEKESIEDRRTRYTGITERQVKAGQIQRSRKGGRDADTRGNTLEA